jgi:hypothetical protein
MIFCCTNLDEWTDTKPSSQIFQSNHVRVRDIVKPLRWLQIMREGCRVRVRWKITYKILLFELSLIRNWVNSNSNSARLKISMLFGRSWTGPARAAHETSYERVGYNSNSSRHISETRQLVASSGHELKPVTRARLVLVELARADSSSCSGQWRLSNSIWHEPRWLIFI